MNFLAGIGWIDVSRDLIVSTCLFVFIAASIGSHHSRLSYYKWLFLIIGTIVGLILTGLSLHGMAKSIAASGPLGFFSTIFSVGPVLPYLYEGVIAAVVFGIAAHIVVELVKKVYPHLPRGATVAAIVFLSVIVYSPHSLVRRQMQLQTYLEQNRHNAVEMEKPANVRKY